MDEMNNGQDPSRFPQEKSPQIAPYVTHNTAFLGSSSVTLKFPSRPALDSLIEARHVLFIP
jgi:hypothetical protein